MSRRAIQVLAPACVAVLWAVELGGDLRRPWHGISVGLLVVAIVATGYVLPAAISLLTVGVTVVAGVVIWSGGWHAEPDPVPGEVCDPSCGLGSASFSIIVFSAALVPLLIGMAARALRRRTTRRTEPLTQR